MSEEKPLDPEFKALLDRFGKEALSDAEIRGRNRAFTAAMEIVRRTQISASTKDWLINQFRTLKIEHMR